MQVSTNKTVERMVEWINQAWYSVRDDWWCNDCSLSERMEEEILEEFEELFGEVPKETIEAALEAADYVAARYLWCVLVK